MRLPRPLPSKRCSCFFLQAYVATVRAITIVAATVWTGDMYIQLVTAALLGHSDAIIILAGSLQRRLAGLICMVIYNCVYSKNKHTNVKALVRALTDMVA